MLSTILWFVLISAVLELVLLTKICQLSWLKKPWFAGSVHLAIAVFNLWYHFGTATGTLVAITSVLVSFVVMPVSISYLTFKKNYALRLEEQRLMRVN